MIDLAFTSQKIAVPGMIDGEKVLLIPGTSSTFSSFYCVADIWRYKIYKTVTTIILKFSYLPSSDSDKLFYSLYHISSNNYLKTNTVDCSTLASINFTPIMLEMSHGLHNNNFYSLL
jgi:hypothetical protein